MMTNKKLAYLAHPFLLKNKIRYWQENIEKNFNVKFINPFYDGPEKKLKIESQYNEKITSREDKDYLVIYDIDCIDKTDFTLAIIDGSTSYGTIMEICYAYNLKKDVYLICTNGYESHPWLQFHCKKIFKTFEEAEEWLKKI